MFQMTKRVIAVLFVVYAGLVGASVSSYLLAVYIDSLYKDSVLYIGISWLIGAGIYLTAFWILKFVLNRLFRRYEGVNEDDIWLISAIPILPMIFLISIALPHAFGNYWMVTFGGDGNNAAGIRWDLMKDVRIAVASIAMSVICCLFILAFRSLFAGSKIRNSLIGITVILFILVNSAGAVFSTVALNALGKTEDFSGYIQNVKQPDNINTDGDYKWVVIETNLEDSYCASTCIFRKSGFVELELKGEPGFYTNLEFFVCLTTPDCFPKQIFFKKPDKIKVTGNIEVSVRQKLGDYQQLIYQDKLTGYRKEHRVQLELPSDFSPANQVIRIEIEPRKGTLGLIYRVYPYAKKKNPRRLVMLSMDTHSLEHMSLFDDKEFDTSPALREILLADKNCVGFAKAIGAGPYTLPTHATVFTGLYPTQHQKIVHQSLLAFNNEIKTLSELLAESQDVYAFHIISNHFLSYRYGFNEGVQYYKEYLRPPHFAAGKDMLQNALELMENYNDRDVFFFINLMEAHGPYSNYPEGYKGVYSKVEKTTLRSGQRVYREKISNNRSHDPRSRKENVEKYAPIFVDEIKNLRTAYELGILDLDYKLKTFFEGMKERRFFDSSTIIAFSDHGEEFFRHGMFKHSSLYNENTGVHLLLKLTEDSPYLPKLKKADKVNRNYFEAHTTLFKVVLDLFGIQYPEYLSASLTNGLDLNELLGLSENKECFLEMYTSNQKPIFYEASIVSEEGWKSIYSTYLDEINTWAEENDYTQIYNLDKDILEVDNLYQSGTGESQALRSRAINKAIDIRGLIFEPEFEGELSKEDIDKLRALGYIK
jgi:arylsulfatase A-like enzyme